MGQLRRSGKSFTAGFGIGWKIRLTRRADRYGSPLSVAVSRTVPVSPDLKAELTTSLQSRLQVPHGHHRRNVLERFWLTTNHPPAEKARLGAIPAPFYERLLNSLTRPRTKPDNAQNQRREYSDVQYCINHASPPLKGRRSSHLHPSWMCQPLVNRSLRRRWYLAARSETYLGLLVPGVVTTAVGALSSRAVMAACIRAQNASSMSK
jgi:hypothetical protein